MPVANLRFFFQNSVLGSMAKYFLPIFWILLPRAGSITRLTHFRASNCVVRLRELHEIRRSHDPHTFKIVKGPVGQRVFQARLLFRVPN